MKHTIVTFSPDIFLALLRAKLVNFRASFINKAINICVWAGCVVFVMGYVMQAFGLAQDYGVFQLAGIFAVVGLFELYGNTAGLVADLDGDRTLVYYLTLPTSMFTVLASYVCYYAIISTSMCFAVLPFGKFLLWSKFNLAAVSWGKFLVFVLLVNTTWSILAFILTAHLASIDKLSTIWVRVIFPLWFLGGFQSSWNKIFSVVPKFAYVMLLNPVTYATEGMRAAMLAQDGFLPFWLCVLAMLGILIGASVWALKAMKIRLDLV